MGLARKREQQALSALKYILRDILNAAFPLQPPPPPDYSAWIRQAEQREDMRLALEAQAREGLGGTQGSSATIVATQNYGGGGGASSVTVVVGGAGGAGTVYGPVTSFEEKKAAEDPKPPSEFNRLLDLEDDKE